MCDSDSDWEPATAWEPIVHQPDSDRFLVDQTVLRKILGQLFGDWEFDKVKFGTDLQLLARGEDRWHFQTRAEIYSLIWVCKQLSIELPRNVLETVAKWIQLAELCQHFRNGMVCKIYHSSHLPKLAKTLESWTDCGPGRYQKGSTRVRSIDLRHWESLDDQEATFHFGLSYVNYGMRDPQARKFVKRAKKFVRKYDRYRVVLRDREELLGEIAELSLALNGIPKAIVG